MTLKTLILRHFNMPDTGEETMNKAIKIMVDEYDLEDASESDLLDIYDNVVFKLESK